MVPNLSQYFHLSSKQKRPHHREEYIPPALRPVLTHMNDPSNFLPSSKFYSVPPYMNRVAIDRGIAIDDIGTIEPLSASNDGVTRGEMKNGVENGLQSGTSYCSGKPTDVCAHSSPQILRHTQRPSQLHFSQPHPQQARAIHNHSNVNVMKDLTQSRSNNTPASQMGVSDHTPSTSTYDEQSQLFEVSTDSMKLTIAREEEVTSSLVEFEDLASYFDPSSEIEDFFD